MVTPNSKIMFCDALIGYGVQGTIGKIMTYRLRHGNGHYGAELNRLYQDKFSRVVPSSINNAPGEPYRALLRAGVAHWQHALSTAEKATYNRLAEHYQHMSGYNLFLRRVLKGEIEMFVDRGDPAAHDYTEATLIQDNAWHELDLSAIVPKGSKAVLFLLEGWHITLAKTFMLRKYGNVNQPVHSRLRILVANAVHYADFVVACDQNSKIDYWAQTPDWKRLNLTVKGWWT